MLFRTVLLLLTITATMPGAQSVYAQALQAPVSFFVTSTGPGQGADLGGLSGADAHCQALVTAAGAGAGVWRAYLSAAATDSAPAVHARDRIGAGPWYNALGTVVATDQENLHGANNLTKETAVNESGEVVNGRGDSPNRHDMLTGSHADGTAFDGDDDLTRGNWTSSDAGSVQLGYHDQRRWGSGSHVVELGPRATRLQSERPAWHRG
jgi:hypothetical protein